jgi:hypothetical protein
MAENAVSATGEAFPMNKIVQQFEDMLVPLVPAKVKSEFALASYTDPVMDGPRGIRLPTIALVVMTKNRWDKLSELVTSVKMFADKFVILDTGAGDDDLVAALCKKCQIFPSRLTVFREPFVNFEVSRNRLMEIAKDTADWLLLLDDDMGLHFEKPIVDIKRLLDPSVGAYLLKHTPNPEYWVARLVRGDRLWKYSGVTHEYLEGGGIGNPKLVGASVWHHFNHGPEKFNRDLKLLSSDIARDPDDVRTIFYLAETLKNLGRVDAAIRFYCMRANMGGWDEEVYMAKYEAARLAKDPEAMKKAHATRPHRAEPAAWLSGYYKFIQPDLGQHGFWESVRASIPMPLNEYLFVIPFCYGPNFISRLESYQ